MTTVTESIGFDQLSNRLIDSVSLVKFKGRVTATIRLSSLTFAQFKFKFGLFAQLSYGDHPGAESTLVGRASVADVRGL